MKAFGQTTTVPRLVVLGVDNYHQEELIRYNRDPERKYELDLSWNLDPFKAVAHRQDIELLADRLCSWIQQSRSEICGVVGYWDFPVTLLQGYLNKKFDFQGPSLRSILKCENKLWSRMEQERVVHEFVPKWIQFDVFSDEREKLKELKLPYWIKPIKSCASSLAYRIDSRDQEEQVLSDLRANVGKVASSFEFFLDQENLPTELKESSANLCLAEECMVGRQVTLEGLVWRGFIHPYAFFDNVNDRYKRSFTRYEYPSSLSLETRGRMQNIASTVIDRFGLDNTTFNIEFFYDEAIDHIGLLEVNPRISQSHTMPIFWVDGFSNIRLACDIAAGVAPRVKIRQGSHPTAAKFFLRHYQDAKVEHVPTPEHLRELERKYSEAKVYIPIREGQWLSDLKEQDSYSYELALIYLNGRSKGDLIRKYKSCRKELTTDFNLNSEIVHAHS